MRVPALDATLIAVNVAHFAISSAMFWRQRRCFPVSGRDPFLVIPSALFLITGDLMIILLTFDAILCNALTIFTQTAALGALDFIFMRLARMWFKYNFASERMTALLREQKSADAALAWYSRRRRWFRTRNLVGAALVVFAATAIVSVTVALSGHTRLETGTILMSDEVCIPAFLTQAVCIVLLLCCFVIIGRKLRNVHEGLWLKRELMWLAVLGVVVISTSWLQNLNAYILAVYDIVRTFNIQVALFIILDYPTWLSISRHDAGTLSVIADDEDAEVTRTRAEWDGVNEPRLIDILTSADLAHLLASFKRHLVGEFNTEALLFFFAVEDLKQLYACDTDRDSLPAAAAEAEDSLTAHSPNDKIASQAQSDDSSSNNMMPCTGARRDTAIAESVMSIFMEFVDEDSPSQINLSYLLSNAIYSELETAISNFSQVRENYLKGTPEVESTKLSRAVDTSVFDSAQRSSVKLLERDPFARWKKAIRDRNATSV